MMGKRSKMAKSAPPKTGPRKLPKVVIRKIQTGVRGLDEILGGGLDPVQEELVAGGDEVSRHGAAHDAQADEADLEGLCGHGLGLG